MKVLFALILFGLLSHWYVPYAFAMNTSTSLEEEKIVHSRVPYVSVMNTGFITEEIPIERQKNIAKNLYIRLLSEEPSLVSISCFDVREDYALAIGYVRTNNRATICVLYSQDGVFRYGYSLSTTGDYEIEWVGENLLIYLVRGGFLLRSLPKER